MLKKTSLVTFLVIILTFGLISLAGAEEEEIAFKLYSTPEMFESETGNTIDAYNEAPEFAEKVAEGELPSIEERLPEEPVVIEPSEEIGNYGGAWHRVWTGVSDEWGINKPIGERFLTWNENIEVVPNIAKDWEVSDDGKSVTFYLRKGMKWSDGEPLTAEDAEYWYEDVVKNEAITPAFPSEFKGPDGEIAEFTKIDDYTFRYDFPASMAQGFVENKPSQCPIHLIAPKHYMKQFNPNYADEAELEELMEEEGFDDLAQLYEDQDHYIMNIERPVIFAWKPVNDPTSSQFRLERNPYYWKVDTEGNQLPYIDEIRNILVEDSEVITMRALSGDVDFQFRHVRLADYSVLKENEDEGGYNAYLAPRAAGAATSLMPNQNIQDDEVKKEIFQDKRFRQALSLAIDREEINEMNYLGQATPRQASFVKNSPFYSEEWEKAYAEFDPERAEALLDEIGLDEKNSDGFRLRPDGDVLRLNLSYSQDVYTADLELIKQYFENIGLKTNIDMQDRSLFYERTEGANFDIAVWGMDRVLRPDLQQRWWVATEQYNHHYAPFWGLYHSTDGEEGEEPHDYYKRLQEISEELQVTTDFDKKIDLMEEVTEIHAEQIHIIGTVGEQPIPGIINKDLKNFPYDVYMGSELLRDIGFAIPQTLFFDN